MHAASVNPIDFKVRNGDLRFLISRNFPLVLGSDGAGVVKDIGKDVIQTWSPSLLSNSQESGWHLC